MPIFLPLKIVIGGIAGATLIATSVFGGTMFLDYLEFSNGEEKVPTVREKLRDLLLDTSSYESEIWDRRKIKLNDTVRGARFYIHPSLSKESDGLQIMKWCNNNLNSEVIWESDVLFLSIKKFCTKDIRDLFRKGELIERNGNWDEAKNRLKKSHLPNSMNKMKNDLEIPNKNSLEEYCLSNYDSPFDPKGENYLNVKSYCTVVKE